MAQQTDTQLRGKLMYSVFVRNHTPEGTFQALERDLDRIAALGTDIIWLLPIHPIGEVSRKGTLGSPYAIRDYRGVNPEYGTLGDLMHLVAQIHERGMKCIIDVVYNHTSPDSVLAAGHPEFFLRDEMGHPTRRVAEWSDIVDLDYRNLDLWKYQIETLKIWAEIVDGFRCDVASSVPAAFWREAREQVEKVHPGCIWLAESVFPGHILGLRRMGAYCAADSELYSAFDITYDYDIWPHFDACFSGGSLRAWTDMVNFQECEYPPEYIKLRCLENHDQPRFASRVKNWRELENWLALLYFEKGMTMLYSGQEFAPQKAVGLFDADDAYCDKRRDLQPYLRQLREMKRTLPQDACFQLESVDERAVVGRYDGVKLAVRGVFDLRGGRDDVRVAVGLADGSYTDRISGRQITVQDGRVRLSDAPCVIG